jgi:hypothetical protein
MWTASPPGERATRVVQNIIDDLSAHPLELERSFDLVNEQFPQIRLRMLGQRAAGSKHVARVSPQRWQ